MKRTVGLLVALLLPGLALGAEPFKIGLAAMISPKETITHYKSIMDYVGSKLGRPVEMVQKKTYDEMDAALQKRELDVAFVCSGPYVRDRDRFGAELLVAPQSYGKPVYYAYIIVPKSSPAKALADLAGKRFGFTDPKSNTGKLVPSYMVAKRFSKMPEAFFGKVVFTYSHDKSIEAVGQGQVDGASVDSLIYDFVAKKNPAATANTRILEKSPPYGIPPVIVNKSIDPATREKLKEIFLKMHEDPKGKQILGELFIDKFVVPQDKDYDSVREMEAWIASQQG